MKKSLIALAVVAASGAAMAQSSVTLYGVADAGIGKIKYGSGGTTPGNDASNKVEFQSGSLMTNGNSRIGVRGVEDLGGGLKAGFWLEGEIFGDDGNASGFNFKRRSTVSLAGGFGEVRLGRDLTPGYSKFISYDLFGQTGIGQFMGWSDWATNSDVGTTVSTADASNESSSNIISY